MHTSAPNLHTEAHGDACAPEMPSCWGTHTPTHDLAITSRMFTAISRGQWQPWTAVLPLPGLIGMA